MTQIRRLWHIYAMRYQAALSFVLCLGAFSHSFAADPPSAPAAPAQATAVSSPTTAASATATAPPASDVKTAADAALVAQTHRLRTAGYKPKVKDGGTIWCKQETALGSRLAQVERCGTPEQIDLSTRNAKDAVETMQRNVTQHQSN